ncbi:uncharacterized protein LOC128883908 [Hylaeus volcanicus]|uniref:uncharacterized protein LOC128883908 n=1 Tax=Hylaeus volcanicus TaxID=313075 RepID=UPI0023B852FA|nr:uncharacterized protein LOC128883908 [Hylaeus volcanicus]
MYDADCNFLSLFWLKDRLMTEMCHDEWKTNAFQTNEFRYFIWKCRFTRYKKKPVNEHFLPIQKLSGTAFSQDFYTIGINRSPSLRTSWCPHDTFFSTFDQCERSDSFWCFSSKKDSFESTCLKPFFLQPDPSCRFLALMVQIQMKNKTFISPTVRIWALYNKNHSFPVKTYTPPISFQHRKTEFSTMNSTQNLKNNGEFQTFNNENLFLKLSQAEKDILHSCSTIIDTPEKANQSNKDNEFSKNFGFSRYSAMQHAVNINTSCCVTSLSHGAPVVAFQWHESGPLTDGVFIPRYVCVVTENHYITVWLESSFDVRKVVFRLFRIKCVKLL